MGGGGKSGGSSSDSAGQAAQTLADISKGLYEEGSAVRGQTQDMTSKILSGQYSPRVLPAYAPMFAEAKKGLEGQYDMAQNKIMSNTPAGGQLYSALADLEMKRASNVGSLGNQLTSGLVSDIINRGTGAAYNSLSATTSGLGTSGAISSNLAGQEAAQEASFGGGIGQLAGTLGAAALLK